MTTLMHMLACTAKFLEQDAAHGIVITMDRSGIRCTGRGTSHFVQFKLDLVGRIEMAHVSLEGLVAIWGAAELSMFGMLLDHLVAGGRNIGQRDNPAVELSDFAFLSYQETRVDGQIVYHRGRLHYITEATFTRVEESHFIAV